MWPPFLFEPDGADSYSEWRRESHAAMAEAVIAEKSPRNPPDRLSFEKPVAKRSVLVVFLVLWGYVVYRVGALWQANSDYAYGWFVPVLCLCLLWERWKRRPAPEAVQTTTGPLIVIAGLVLALVLASLCSEVLPERRVSVWLISATAIGISLCMLYLVGGQSWANHFAFPFFFFLIAVPWPSRLEAPLIENLSKVNAAASTIISNLMGVPAMRQGTLIQTGSGLVGVDEACSGIRSFQSSVMIALFLGELFCYGLFRRVFFLISGVGLALMCNVVRTTYLVRVCDARGNEAVKASHDPAGFTILGVTLLGLLFLAWIFRPRSGGSVARVKEAQKEASHGSETSKEGEGIPSDKTNENPLMHERKFAFGALLGVLAISLAVLEISLHGWFSGPEDQAKEVRPWSLKLPTSERGYAEEQTPANIRQMLKPDEALHCQWGEPGTRAWQLYYFRWNAARNFYQAVAKGARAKGHAPDVCLSYAGMTLEKDFGESVSTVNGVTLLKRVQRFNDGGRALHVLSCYWTPLSSQLQVDLKREAAPVQTAAAVIQGLKKRDRSRAEQRVIKVGVWGMQSDPEAAGAFDQLLQNLVRP